MALSQKHQLVPEISFWLKWLFLGLIIQSGIGCTAANNAFPLSFLHKKIRVKPAENGIIVPVFYVTNRLQDKDPASGTLFTAERSDKLGFGSATVFINNRHRMGGPRKNAKLAGAKIIQRKKFLTKIKASLKASATGHLVIWTHGYKKGFETGAIDSGLVAYDLDLDATYLYFSWASKNSVFSYGDDLKMVQKTAPQYVELLNIIVNEIQPKSISIMAHSMGSQLVCSSFDLMEKDPRWFDKQKELQHVVLIAPDVSDDEFHKAFKKQIERYSKRLSVYVSSDDTALLASKFYHGGNRLGNTLDERSSQMEEFNDLMALNAEKTPDFQLDVIDVTLLGTNDIFHHAYFRNRAMMTDMYWLMNIDRPASARHLVRSDFMKGNVYWVAAP